MIPRVFCLVSTLDEVAVIPQLARAGVGGFQVRSKQASTSELVDFTRAVMHAAPGCVVTVNDRVDVALAAGAHGVHLGADDLAVTDARRLAPDLVIGATCRDRGAVIAAARGGATYAGLGPVFASGSKSGLPDPLGVDAITAAAGVLPLIAIGGVTRETARDLRSAGAHGVAVIGGIWRERDPVAAAKELVTALA